MWFDSAEGGQRHVLLLKLAQHQVTQLAALTKRALRLLAQAEQKKTNKKTRGKGHLNAT